MKNIWHTIKVILVLAKMQLSSQMMYRLNFFGVFIADLSLFMIQLLFFGVISQNGSIGDWNIHHLTVFTGTFIALDGLYMATYFFGIISLPKKIRDGSLDLAIIKPVNTLVYTTFGSLNIGSFLLFFVGLGIVAYGGTMLGVMSVMNMLRFSAVFVLMYTLVYALMLIVRCFAFWLIQTNAFNRIEDTFIEFSFKLPMPAIKGAWRILLFIALPYGLIANMPSTALFGSFGLRQWLLCLGVTFGFLTAALLMWRLGRKKYDSASS